jgi:exopolyphosphatase/pppGpp-phosphohydrolase
MTPEDIRRLTPVAAGREDILGAGALLLAKAMERLGTAGIGVSTAGLRHGVVMSLWRELTGGRPEAPASG